MNDIMAGDGARNNWRDGKEVNDFAPVPEITETFSDEDFKEPMPTQDNKYVTPLEALQNRLKERDKEIARMKEEMQTLRRKTFRPKAARDEELERWKLRNEELLRVNKHLAKKLVDNTRVRTTSNARFTDIVQKRIKQCTDILFVKNKEYSSETDRLHNFKVAAQYLGTHPISALKGMMVKHEVSIFDMMSAVIRGEQPPSYILMDEKFGDIHNYYYLLEALIEEYRDE